ncbi:hypothetical protein G3P90_004038 [Escherichia coli]|nr:hypothetical protein [Escherichia coli]EFI9178518.1 hypothetical protein [Escherichia coli]EFJ0061724.1 hypothetical protein [Escherichia coli]TJH26867.1 hypothetical protein C9157_26625 [Escherichia coli]TJR28330.1 hypothetical protein C9Z43_26680 [Escherichia coli]
MGFEGLHYVLIYQTVTSLTYVFVPLDFRLQFQRRTSSRMWPLMLMYAYISINGPDKYQASGLRMP